MKCFNQYHPGYVYFMAEMPKQVLGDSNDDMNLHVN